MLFCCNKKMKLIDTISLQPIGCYELRELQIYKCGNCESLNYTLTEYDMIKNCFVYDRNKPKKKKNVQDWANNLIKLSKAFTYLDDIKKGNRSNMGFIYGRTTAKEHIGYDFNGTIRHRAIIQNGR